MRFDEAVKELSPATVEALRVLESEGFQVFLDVRIEDCTKPDGHRRRTFANRGRYAVGALLKNLSGRERVEFPAFAPNVDHGITAEPFVQEVVDEPTGAEVSENVEIDVLEVEETEVVAVEPELKADHKAVRSHHKKKPEMLIKKRRS